MSNLYDPRRLPLAAFARSGGQLPGSAPLADFPRLYAQSVDAAQEAELSFSATGGERFDATGHPQVWLHVSGHCQLTLECQRCLRPARLELGFGRDFRFVANEALAAVEDEESDEDVLVFARQFDLLELVEDELLMAMPLVPMHDTCPVAPRFSVADANFDATAAQPANPFAVLADLKRRPEAD